MVRARSFVLLAVALGIASVASAGPISFCTNNIGDSGFTCNFFETTAAGVPSDTSNVVAFPVSQSTSAGYVVLLESPGGSHFDSTQWSDVLQFIDNGTGAATSAQLFSSTSPSFPTPAQVNSAANLFLVENQTGTGNDFIDSTQFVAGFNAFNIFSASPVSGPSLAPEPASIGLVGLALILAFARMGKKLARC